MHTHTKKKIRVKRKKRRNISFLTPFGSVLESERRRGAKAKRKKNSKKIGRFEREKKRESDKEKKEDEIKLKEEDERIK